MNNLVTIIRKELKGYFDHPVGYLVVIVFLVVNNFFFFRTLFISNIATLRPMFDFLPWLLLFMIPAVTMRLGAEERKSGTWEIVLTHPISDTVYLLGKWLAATFFVLSGILATLLIPIIISMVVSSATFGGDAKQTQTIFDWGVISGQYIGSFLFTAAFSALGLFASQITKNQIIAFLTSVAIGFFFILAGLDIVVLGLPQFMRNIFTALSITGHFQSIARGVIDLRDIIYFTTFCVVWLVLAMWQLKKPRVSSNNPSWRRFRIGVAITVVLTIIINLFSPYVSLRLDMTANKVYTLSDGTTSLAKNLKDIVHITVFISKEIPPEVAPSVQTVKDVLRDITAAAHGNIVHKYIDPSASPENGQKASSFNIPPVQFNLLKKDEFQVKQGYFGLAIEYAGEHESIPFISNTSDFEYQLAALIKKLTATEKRTVAFTEGHGEKSPSEFQGLITNISRQYEIGRFDESAPPNPLTTTLFIAGPTSPMTTTTESALNAFLTAGGSALVLLDGVTLNPQTLSANANNFTNELLSHKFGVTVAQDIAYDIRSHESVTFGGGIINYILPYPFWVRAGANPGHSVTGRIESVVLPWASTLVISPSSEFDVTPLIQTTSFGFHITGPTFSLAPDQTFETDESKLSNQLIAVAITPKPSNASFKGRLIVVGDSDFLSDQFIQNASNNLAFAQNALDWLAADESLIHIRSKDAIAAPLVFQTDSQKAAIKYLNLIGIPILITLAGVVRIFLRRRKSKQESLVT